MVLKNVKLDSLLVSYLDSAGVDVVPGGLETELLKSSVKVKWSRSVMSDSSRPHGLQPTRLLHPWEFPGKSTGVGCHCLLWKSSEFLNWTCPFLQVGFIFSSRFFHVVVCYSPGDLRDSIELNWRFSCFTSQGRRGLPNRLQIPRSRGRLWLAHFVSGDPSLQLEEWSPPTTCFETFTGGKIVLL